MMVAIAIADVTTADGQTAYRLAAIAESPVDREISTGHNSIPIRQHQASAALNLRLSTSVNVEQPA
jgi:hypothetical protein